MSLSSRSNTPFNSTSNNPLLNIHPTTSPFCAHQPPSTPQCYKNKNLTSRPSTPGIGKPEFSKILIPFPSYLINSFSPRTFILSRSLPTPLALPASLMKFCHDARAGGRGVIGSRPLNMQMHRGATTRRRRRRRHPDARLRAGQYFNLHLKLLKA